jgi:hypothetical protein
LCGKLGQHFRSFHDSRGAVVSSSSLWCSINEWPC